MQQCGAAQLEYAAPASKRFLGELRLTGENIAGYCFCDEMITLR